MHIGKAECLIIDHFRVLWSLIINKRQKTGKNIYILTYSNKKLKQTSEKVNFCLFFKENYKILLEASGL